MNRLRSPDPRAPCVERRTRGAAQKRRGGCAAEKRWWGRPSPAWKAGSLVPRPWRGFPVPTAAESPLSGGSGKPIPQAALPPAPFTQGGLYGAASPQISQCRFAAKTLCAPGRFDKRKKCGRAAARMIYDCLFRIRHSRALRRVISLVRASTRSYWGVSTRGVPSRTRGRRRCLHRKMHRRFQPQVRGVAKTGTDGQMGSCSDMIGSSLRSRAAPGLLPAAGACFSPRHQCSTDGGNILSKTVGKGVFSKIFSDFFEKGPEKPRFSRSFSGKRAKAGDFSKRRGPGGGDISPKMG